MRKIQIGILIVIVGLGGIMIKNGIFSRDATLAEAKAWGTSHIISRNHSGSYSGEVDTFYNSQGQAVDAQQLMTYSYTTKFTGRVALWKDDGAGFGNFWCFELAIEPTNEIGSFGSECWRVTVNRVTGQMMDDGTPSKAPKQALVYQ